MQDGFTEGINYHFILSKGFFLPCKVYTVSQQTGLQTTFIIFNYFFENLFRIFQCSTFVPTEKLKKVNPDCDHDRISLCPADSFVLI